MNCYDLIIAGGGPAGTAAAITAANRGVRVALFERGYFPRHKVCGEFVSSEALALLGKLLGSAQQVLLTEARRTTAARLFVDGCVAQFPMPPAASIPRYELDAALWRAAESAGVDVRPGITVQQIAQDADRFEVTTTAGRFVSRAAMNTSGRWSNLRRPSSMQDGNRAHWLGLKAHFQSTDPSRDTPTTDLYFFQGGYCGVQPLSGAEVNVCAMVRADIATRMEDVLLKHPALHERSAGWIRTTDVVATAPLIFKEPQPVLDRIFCAGDAAAFIDPFVGDGISIALRSGVLASEALHDFWSGCGKLDDALHKYELEYHRTFSRPLRIAATVRTLLAAPKPLRFLALGALKLPIFARCVMRLTR